MQTASVTKNSAALPSYVFARVENKRLDSVRDSLEDVSYLDWYGSTTGRYDLVLSLKGSEPKQVYSAIKSVREIDGVEATTSFTPFEGYARKQTEQGRSLGQVFLRTRGNTTEVLDALKQIPAVSEVLVVPGEWDLVVTVRGDTYEDILKTSVEQISQIDGVSASETSFVYQQQIAD